MADVDRIVAVGMQTLTLIEKFAQQGQDFTKILVAGKKVFSKDSDQITDEELDATEQELDDLEEDFLKPLDRKE